MVFYTATGFPQNTATMPFIAMRGSWNLAAHRLQARTGSFQDGKPVGLRTSSQDSCLKTDQYISGDSLAVAPDGSLLISEDTNGVIYRVSSTGRN